MKLYAEYLKERDNVNIKYTNKCFVTYKVYKEDNSASIIDIYSKPEIRGKQIMKEFVEDLLKDFKKENIETVYGFTDERTNGWERSEQLMLKFGFKYCGKDPDDKYRNNYYKDL